MQETIEFRMLEEEAKKYLRPDEGKVISTLARKLILPFTDERVKFIGKISKKVREEGSIFVTCCLITRKYTKKELQQAELLKLSIRKTFEPAGEECGTLYDETDACPRCGLNRKQTSDLILDVKKINKKIDIARTIAGEVIVSARFVESWKNFGLKGASFMPVLQKRRTPIVTKDWCQIIITSEPLEVALPTHAGNDPFNDDLKGQYKCPGHVLGLNLISELTVTRKSYDGSDLVTTDLAFGWKQGLLMPERPLILSQKAWDCLRKDGIKGFNVEVVHLH